MTVTLTTGCSADLDGVMNVMGAAFAEEFGEAWTRAQCSGILPMTGVKLLLACTAEQVVGFALYRTVAGDSELLLLAVAPEAQGDGVGRALLEQYIEDSKKNDAESIHLEVRDGNSAVRLYEAAGFQQTNRRKNYYRGRGGAQFDALTFMLSA
ncbi:ribosomal protein S18-alanine N-acetyltransferase [Sphingomonas sabuli]|uniref:[Ribosomal protein bS18]-alanine N-acetyltransferase n=1 Tax=Sphingomonas sabuli TaxID=2764186 RepID=A0A7G9L556_9SPHN|nr:ribosomal protein S18-alanine N-acetyltransferase [Sphingomonas sabuli]QNM83755.1 ribosomal protein S18-alanine N-acetyltransferase [Sphingomonas sabuli]